MGRCTAAASSITEGPEGRGERVRRARRRRGLSLAATAGLAGRSKGWLSMIENGRLQLDSLSDMLKLAAVLRVPVASLTGIPVCAGCRATGETGALR